MANATISFTIFGKDLVLNPATYFTVFGFDIHWYGVIIAVGMFCGVFYIMHRSKEFGLTEDNIIDMLLIVVPLGVIGSRILYVMFNFDKYKNNLAAMFKIWEGGLAIYGGIALGIAGLYIYCRRKKMPLAVFLDVAALALLIAQSIGRWGNFINREVYGVQTDLPWAMKFTMNGNTIGVHPLFLYESIWNFVGFIALHFYSKRRKYDGELFAMYVFWYGLARYFFEQLREDSVLYLFNTDIRVSQLIGLLSLCAAFIYMLRRAVRKSYNPDKLYVRAASVSVSEYNADAANISEAVEKSADYDVEKNDYITQKTENKNQDGAGEK